MGLLVSEAVCKYLGRTGFTYAKIRQASHYCDIESLFLWVVMELSLSLCKDWLAPGLWVTQRGPQTKETGLYHD